MTTTAAARRSQSAGAGFESRLEQLHQQYANQRRAHILPRPPRARLQKRPPGDKGAPRLAALQPIGADYSGFIAGGCGLSFDAKSQAEGRRFNLSKVPDIQVRDLVLTARMGHLAFFLVDVRGGAHRGLYVVPVYDDEDWRGWLGLGERIASVPLVGPASLTHGVLRVDMDYLAGLEAAGVTGQWPGQVAL